MIYDQKCYNSILDIPENIKYDTVNVFRNLNAIPEVYNDIIKSKRNINCVWLQLGLHNNEYAEMFRKKGVTVIENKCIKIEHHKLNAASKL